MYTAILTSLVLAGGSLPAPEVWLESELHRRYATVTQWRIREVLPQRAADDLRVERFEVGPLGSRTFVLVHGRDSNGRPTVARRWYEVAGFGPSVVMTRPLSALATVTPDMVALAPVDMLAQHCAPLSDPASAVGMRLLQSRHEGDALCASMLGTVPAVARGKTVTVQVTAGAVVLRTEAIARADASVGERVQLYRLTHTTTNSNSDPFWGVVTAPGEVRVDE
jgi:flagella basal body P-ring formation protein FlgA